MPPEINLSYYSGSDLYSDGDIEEELMEMVSRDPHTVLREDNRWPVLYHLSPERRNLLEWYPFRPEGSLLEIGAGCGALTGLFSERLRDVTAVELSRKRAEIIKRRHESRGNIELLVGNFMDMEFDHGFDYVTLIGVLEYARLFVENDDPWGALLSAARRVLNPDGVLLLAIENKFGIKYFSGAREDHTGRPFSGIEGYLDSDACETFSRDELQSMLTASGFADQEFYYPHPDYKLPEEIFSDRFQPPIHHRLTESLNYDRDRLRVFNERLALFNITRAGRFDFFANSFLVVAGS